MRLPLLISGLCLAAASQAAIVITSEDMGGTSTQYFDRGRFVSTENGQPNMGMDADGNCWFVDENQLVKGRCDDMVNKMKDFRSQMMSGMGEQQRAMMKQAQSRYMQMQKAPKITEVAGQDVAGLGGTRCFHVNDASHLMCTNKKLGDRVKNEMGGNFYEEMQNRFSDVAKGMGMAGMQESAEAQLAKKGYVVKDVKAAMPMGMNPAMMQFLSPDQKEALMKQFKSAGQGPMQGMTVTSVDKDGSIPPMDLSAYRNITFDDYVQRMMQQMPRF